MFYFEQITGKFLCERCMAARLHGAESENLMRVMPVFMLSAALLTTACNRVDAPGKAAPAPGTDRSLPSPLTRSDAPPSELRTSAIAAGEAPSAPAQIAPTWNELTIPAGTAIPVLLDTSLGSDVSQVEQAVSGHTTRPITIDGLTALPEGTTLGGVVTSVKRAGKVKGRAHLSMRFTSIDPPGSESYRIQTQAIGRTAPATKQQDAIKIGAPAAGGAIVGGILGGKKGAAIGTAAGGGAGTAVVLSTRGKEVSFPKGSAVTVRLTQPLTVRVRG